MHALIKTSCDKIATTRSKVCDLLLSPGKRKINIWCTYWMFCNVTATSPTVNVGTERRYSVILLSSDVRNWSSRGSKNGEDSACDSTIIVYSRHRVAKPTCIHRPKTRQIREACTHLEQWKLDRVEACLIWLSNGCLTRSWTDRYCSWEREGVYLCTGGIKRASSLS